MSGCPTPAHQLRADGSSNNLIILRVPPHPHPVSFRVKAPLARRPPHRPVLEELHSYGSSVYTRTRFHRSAHVKPERRHSFWRITMLPCKGRSNRTPLHSLSEGTVTRFVGSESLPSFISEIVMPGFSFPTMGRLGLTSPPYRQDRCPDIGTMIR